MRGDRQRAAFLGGRDESEQQLGAGVVQRREPDLVQDQQVVAEQGVDDPADRVVGQAPVEGLDEIGGGAVLDAVSGGDRGVSEADQGVALAGARRRARRTRVLTTTASRTSR